MEAPRQPPVMLEILEEFDDIRSTVEMFISALMDNHTNIIGIYGVGDIGNTRIASRINEKVKREKLFEAVLMVTVGRSFDPEATIAQAIHDYFIGRFQGGNAVGQTSELHSKLFAQKRVLIILDDVLESIDLERAGIPEGRCKILIMSRYKKVCLQIGCKMIFKLHIKWDTCGRFIGSASKSSASLVQSIISNILDSIEEVVGETSSRSNKSQDSVLKGRKYCIVLDDLWSVKVLMTLPLQSILDPSKEDDAKEDDAERAGQRNESAQNRVFKNSNRVRYLINLGDESRLSCVILTPLKMLKCRLVDKAGDGNRWQIEEMNNGVKSEEPKNGNKKYLKDFILFCSVLPLNYEFTKDVLVWMWIAGGLIKLGEDKVMEEVCKECFDTLVDVNYFVPSSYDHIFHQMKYKIGDEMTTFLQKQPLKPKFAKYLDCNISYAAEVEHMSITFKDIDHMELGAFKQYVSLQTLVSYDGYGLDHLPSYIFSELETLKILNLSGTNIVVLPSSIENLKELRFLDISRTPIHWLPETICYFSHLETLNVDSCLQLRRLPKCMDKLINLRHLILDVRRLQSMPVGIGKLSNLRTLNAFLVGKGNVGELKDLNKLRGSFCLLNLENVGSKEEALEACLYNKVDLRKIELHWSDIQDDKSSSEEEILESLRPPTSIQELGILFYSGEVLPSWICSREFSELESINLYGCKYCSSLPSLGELPSLKSLSINENNEVVEIDSSFFRKQTNQHRVAFPKLEKLSFDSMSKLEKWTGFENGDFPSLRNLIIEYCPRFLGFAFLSHLNSLSRLEIRYCPELLCLPEDGLPPSLESLMIKQSPKLKAQCCDEQWEDWSKIARVVSIYIDDQEFSPKTCIIQDI